MSYKERVERVIDFIGKHLDEELELDELCRIACFSKHHFHRLFTVYLKVSTLVQLERISEGDYRPLLPVDNFAAAIDKLHDERALPKKNTKRKPRTQIK